jgi:AcrR family transcriptional regulator
MTTKEKILAAALTVFNRDGAMETTTNHVAAEAGISPGNLYYHYQNKEALVRGLFERLDAALDALFVLPTDRSPSLSDLEGLLEANFDLLWQYRFFYRDQLALLRRDPSLQALYRRSRERGFTGTRELVALFASSGVLEPLQPSEIEALSRVAYLISDFWLASLELSEEPITPTRFRDGIQLLRVVLEPRLNTSKTP